MISSSSSLEESHQKVHYPRPTTHPLQPTDVHAPLLPAFHQSCTQGGEKYSPRSQIHSALNNRPPDRIGAQRPEKIVNERFKLRLSRGLCALGYRRSHPVDTRNHRRS